MNIAVLIPSYRRPRVLAFTLPSWLRGRGVRYVVIVADSPFEKEIEEYRRTIISLKQQYSNVEVVYDLFKGRRGSIKARNTLLKFASVLNTDFALMADDDYFLPNPNFTKIMASYFQKDSNIGAVGGRVIMVRRRSVDPDFFLNAPINVADPLSRITGYVFLDVMNGPRYAEFLPHFYMIRKDVLKLISYDSSFETPTAFREESDVHVQIKKLGYRLILDPRIYVFHLGLEEGGDRPPTSMAQRMYWKARNHVIFVVKHHKSTSIRLWYMFMTISVLSLYRPWHVVQVLRGLRDALKLFR